jgi:hypothetical protein
MELREFFHKLFHGLKKICRGQYQPDSHLMRDFRLTW